MWVYRSKGKLRHISGFLAEGDRLIYQRLESTDAGVEALYCNECHEQIEIDDGELDNLVIV